MSEIREIKIKDLIKALNNMQEWTHHKGRERELLQLLENGMRFVSEALETIDPKQTMELHTHRGALRQPLICGIKSTKDCHPNPQFRPRLEPEEPARHGISERLKH